MEPEMPVLDLSTEFEETVLPSNTYRVEDGRILGMVDGLGAIVQAVDKLLNTELWENLIYGDDYGVELERFLGQELAFIESDLERTITSALEVDDRFLSIEEFVITRIGKDFLLCTFNVVSVEGEFKIERRIDL